jgi:hypothetical protein
MNFGQSFSFVFQDKDWFKKLILPALCMLIPIVGWMVTLGWALQVTKNLIDGSEEPLPDLQFGADLGRGLFAFLISFVYNLPSTLLTWMSTGLSNLLYQVDVPNALIALLSTGLGILAFALSLAASFLSVAGIANYIAKGDFGAGFQVGDVFSLLKSNFTDWLLVVVGIFLAIGIIGPLGAIACGIGVFLTLTYGLAVTGHLMGQAYNRSQTPTASLKADPENV